MSRSRPKWTDLKEVRRWLTLRCERCGHRFRWKRDYRFSFGGDRKVYHDACMDSIVWRSKAEERLDSLAVVLEIGSIGESDVTATMGLRATSEADRIAASNKAFRVFRDLRRREERQAT